MIATLATTLLVLAGPKLELSVGAGGDSNPFELPDDQAAAGAESRPAPGAFIPVEASAEWKTPSRRVFRAGVDSWFDGRFFTFVAQDGAAPEKTNARDANRWSGGISAPIAFDPFAGRRGSLGIEVTVEPFFGAHRETYTSHRTGTPLLFDDRPGEVADVMIDLSKRYDTNEFGARADGDLELGRIVELIGGATYTSVDYLEDYESSEHLDSWDYDELRADLDGFVRPGDWTVAAGYSLRARSYDSRFPRDDAGEKIEDDMPGFEPQVFTYHDLRLRVGYVRPAGRAVLRFRNTRRIDGFAGYQSYAENAVSGDFRIALREDSELRFEPGYSVRTYDELRVAYDPEESVSNRRRVTMDLGYEWPAFSKRTRLFVSAGLVSQASANPLYAYVEFQGMTGVRAQWR
jgi:hypothetical protein